jgi:hypothetical protein
MKTNSSRGPLFCRRRSQIMVFEGLFKFSAYSSVGRRFEELSNWQGQDWVQAKPAAFAPLIILRHRILANGFPSRQISSSLPSSRRANLSAIRNPILKYNNITKSGGINYRATKMTQFVFYSRGAVNVG